MQQSQSKRSQFLTQIRRKQISQRMQTLRSQYQLTNYTENDYQKYMPIIEDINKGNKKINECLRQLQILSYWKEGAQRIGNSEGIVEGIFGIVMGQPNPKQQDSKTPSLPASPQTYTSCLTILLNLCVHIQLPLPIPLLQQVLKSLPNPPIQIISFWFLANIVYQKSQFSKQLSQQLLSQSCNILQYLQKRIKLKFIEEGDIVIVFYFCTCFMVVGIDGENVSKRVFGILAEMLKMEGKAEENMCILGEALVDYGYYIKDGNYCFFQSQIHKKYQFFCTHKKSKHIKYYLRMLINFTKADPTCYTQFLKYKIFPILSYCLQNRLPQIKRLCCEISYSLLSRSPQNQQIDIENIPFFNNILLEMSEIEKYGSDVKIGVLRAVRVYFVLLVGENGRVGKGGKGGSKEVKGILNQIFCNNLVGHVAKILIGSLQHMQTFSTQLTLECLQLLFLFISIDQEQSQSKILHILHSTKLLTSIQNILITNNNVITNDKNLYQKLCQFGHVMENNGGSMDMR